jgi:hypothetical protein
LPDKESRKRRERKRTLGGSGSMPAELRGRFTEGESAELCVIAGEVKRCGACDFVIEIADRWGRQDNGAKRYHSVKGGGMMWGRANGGLHRLGSLGNESFEGLLSTPSRRPPTRDSERGCV